MSVKNLAQGGACAVLLGALAACGGGNAGSPKYPGVDDPGSTASTPSAPSTPATPVTPTKNPPVIAAQPQNQSPLNGASATFTVTATGNSLSYQWSRNGVAINGATTASYTVPNAGYLDNGTQYSVAVTNADGSVTSNTAQLNLSLSPDQQAFETFNVAPGTGSVVMHWLMQYAGGQINGTDYAYSEMASTLLSPLVYGPQINTQGAPQNVSHTLNLTLAAPTRVLKAGAILLVPQTLSSQRISYVGSNVQVDTLANDNTTTVYTETRSNFSHVALTGILATTPDEFAHALNTFFSNTTALDTTMSYATGSAYLRYDTVSKGDRYVAIDCHATTTDANVSPCSTGTTLQAALTTGIVSNSDGTTYHLADGVSATAEGVHVWVASTARPLSSTQSATVQYRVYFELNGSIYTGSLIKDGTAIGGSGWVSNPAGATLQDRLTYLTYQVRLNKAARDSIAAAALF